MEDVHANAPLGGLRVIEVSSFVASPLCGLSLAQLGAEVIRVDPVGGAADHHRWPVTANNDSIYWTGLNRGKRSVTCDLQDPADQRLIQGLITDSRPGAGILITNMSGREWLSHDVLRSMRPDVITLEVLGRRDGGAGVDYTVNAATGFPFITGSASTDVVNHALPAWDIACGLYAALALTAAVRRRERTGLGARITLPLEDVALATAGTLGYLTEVQVNGRQREATGNYVYGTYGTPVTTADGDKFMLVALTTRHFRALVALTNTGSAIAQLETELQADFSTESDRYRHRERLTALFAPWFRAHGTREVQKALRESSVLHAKYRTFAEVVESTDVQSNPLFETLDQPAIGSYLAAGSPAMIDGRHLHVGRAPQLGEHNDWVLREIEHRSAGHA